MESAACIKSETHNILFFELNCTFTAADKNVTPEAPINIAFIYAPKSEGISNLESLFFTRRKVSQNRLCARIIRGAQSRKP